MNFFWAWEPKERKRGERGGTPITLKFGVRRGFGWMSVGENWDGRNERDGKEVRLAMMVNG